MLSDTALRKIDEIDITGELAAFFRTLTDTLNADIPATSGKRLITVSATRGSDDPVDAHDGSDAKPYATIAFVINSALVAAGDTILVEPGTYTGYLALTVPVNIVALVPGTVTITNAGTAAGAAALTIGAAMVSGLRKMVVFGCQITGFNGNTNVCLGISALVAGATGLAIDFVQCGFTSGVSGMGVINILEATATCRVRFLSCIFGVGTLSISRCDTGATHDEPVEFVACSGSLSLAMGSAGIWALKMIDCAFRAGAITEVGTTAGWIKIANSEITLPAFWAGAVAETSDLYPVRAQNQLSLGWIYYAGGNVTALDIVTIGARVYEYTAGAGVSVPGYVEVAPGGAGPWAPAVAVPALIAAINADATRVADAVIDGSGAAAMLIGRDSVAASALAQVTATGFGFVSAANLTAGQARALRFIARRAYTVTAADVIKWAIGVTHEVPIGSIENPGALPVAELEDARFGAIGGPSIIWAATTLRVRQVNARDYVVALSIPGALFAAGDVIIWSAWA